MDVSFVTGNQGIIEVHVRIWQLFRVVCEQITEWKCLTFFKVRGWRGSCSSPQSSGGIQLPVTPEERG